MGTDVHYVIEMETPDQGWVGIMGTGIPGAPHWNQRRAMPFWRFKERDYRFFGALCGIRGGRPKINAIPGLPGDASSLTKFLANDLGSYKHNYHHCSFRDFVRAKMHANEGIAEAAANKLKGNDPVLEYLGMSQYEHEDLDRLRVCFWFDN